MRRSRGARGLRALLPGGAVQGRPLRRLVHHRRAHHRDLLPAELPGPARPSPRTCASTPRRPPPSRPGSGPASGAGPTPRPVRRSGTSAPTWWPAPCGSSPTASSTARASAGSPAASATAPASSSGSCWPRSAPGPSPSPGPSGPRPPACSSRPPTSPSPQVAFAAGFSSIRQFNDTVRQVFATRRRPTLRTKARASRHDGHPDAPARCRCACPSGPRCDRTACSATSPPAPSPGLEEVRDGAYRRTLRLPGGPRSWRLAPTPDHVACRLTLADSRDLQLGDRPLPPAARPRRRPRGRRRGPERRPRPRPVGGQGARATGAPHRRRARARHPGGARPAGEPASRVTPGRPPPRRLRRAGGRPGGGLRRTWPTVEALAAADPDELDAVLAMPASRRRSVRRHGRGPRRRRRRARPRGRLAGRPGHARHGCPASARGPSSSSPCGASATPTPSAPPTSASAGARPPSASRPTSSPGRRAGAPGAAYAVQHLWAALDHPINHWPPTAAAATLPEQP